jgi:hypothetical protein
MQTLEQKLSAVDAQLKRWQTRLTRASNMVVKLDRKRRRLQLQALQPKDAKPVAIVKVKNGRVSDVTPLPELDVFFQPETKPIEGIAALDVPDYLKRTSVQPKESAADKRVREIKETKGPVEANAPELRKLLDPAAEINRMRLARNDAKRRGYKLPAKVDKTAMPLSGKAALAAIKGKRQ